MYYDLEKEIHYIAKYKVAIYFALPCFFSSSFRVMPRHIDIAEREPFNMLHQRNIVVRKRTLGFSILKTEAICGPYFLQISVSIRGIIHMDKLWSDIY